MNKLEKDEEKVLVGIIVQQFQPITKQGVIKEANKLDFELDEDETIYILENMQRRDIASVIYKSVNNKRVKAYGMAKPMFKKCPEIAQLKDMLPTLIKSKGAKDFLKVLEGESSGTKKKRELGYRDYKKVKIKLLTTQPIVGGSLQKPKEIDSEIKKKVSEIRAALSKNLG